MAGDTHGSDTGYCSLEGRDTRGGLARIKANLCMTAKSEAAMSQDLAKTARRRLCSPSGEEQAEE